jgi:hypothetical protein
MNGSHLPVALMTTLLLACAMPLHAGPAAANVGAQRAANGATDAVTAPVRLAEGISQDTAALGPVGVVTGTVKGGARAAGQLVTGAANVGVGIVEVLVSPFTRR